MTPVSLGVLGDLRIYPGRVTNVARASILGTGAALCVLRDGTRNMLKLRTIGPHDYSVLEDGQRIGRIRFADDLRLSDVEPRFVCAACRGPTGFRLD
jgi:hypothetical protein